MNLDKYKKELIITMKYYSAIEFNNMYWSTFQNKPFQDKWSRDLVKNLLRTLKASNIIDFTDIKDTEGNICYDLLVTNADGTKTAIEIKFRSKTSNAYPSHMINSDKYERLQVRRDRGEFQKAFLYSIWYDGAVWISNIFGPSDVETHLQNKTTNVSKLTDGQKDDKEGHYYKPQQVFYFCYEVGDTTQALFFKKPISQEAINKKNEMTNAPQLVTSLEW